LKTLVQLAIINTTSTFKLNEQIVKKGKRKVIRITPSFITSDSLRLTTSLKLLRNAASKNQKAGHFYEKLANEILASFIQKSQAVDKKNEIQKQILINKRYLSKFRW
jgi:ribosomal protein S7